MSHGDDDSSDVSSGSIWTIVVAGGSGLRFGSRKQFAQLAGRSVLERSVAAASRVSAGVVVVVPDDAVEDQRLGVSGVDVRVVAGGGTRAESVRAGLDEVPGDAAYVLVHDAARPLASPELFQSVVMALEAGAEAVVPAVRVTDTIRDIGGGAVDRDRLLAIQTPQGFPARTLRHAHAAQSDATDDAILVEALGHDVVVVEGEAHNRKLTEPTDLIAAAALITHFEATR